MPLAGFAAGSDAKYVIAIHLLVAATRWTSAVMVRHNRLVTIITQNVANKM